MAVAQDNNNNFFPIAFALVEGETVDGWRFFLKNLKTHVAPQANLYQVDMLLLRVLTIIMITDGIVLILPMFIGLDISRKILYEQSKTRTFAKKW